MRVALLCARAHLPPNASSRNLPFNITPDEMFDIFGKYGAIRQIRVCVAGAARLPLPSLTTCLPLCRGSTKETRGTAYVVYEDIYDAKAAGARPSQRAPPSPRLLTPSPQRTT